MQVQVLFVFFSYYIIIHIFFSLQKNAMLCVKASAPHSCCGVYTSVNRCNLCLSPPHLSHCCSHPAVLQVSPLYSLSADRGPQQLVLFLWFILPSLSLSLIWIVQTHLLQLSWHFEKQRCNPPCFTSTNSSQMHTIQLVLWGILIQYLHNNCAWFYFNIFW